MPAIIHGHPGTLNYPKGNRCGFVLAAPRLLAVLHRHPFISALQQAARAFYEERRNGWLWLGRKRWRHRERGATHDRLPRGERAEAVALVAQFILGHVDLANLKIRHFPYNVGLSIKTIALGTGLSVDRIKGALSDLHSCGYIGGVQEPKQEDSEHYPIARRWIRPGLLETLGRVVGRNFIKWLEQLRGKPLRREPVQQHTAGMVRSFVGGLVQARRQI